MAEANTQKALVAPGAPRAPALLAVYTPPLYTGYDAAEEEAHYARALLAPAARAALDAELKQTGYMTIPEVRALLASNTNPRCSAEGIYTLDADLIAQLDVRLNQPVFILPDNTVYSRQDLLDKFPFAELRTTPEQIFAQQEIGEFAVRASNLDQTAKEYQARDLGTDDEFVMFEDLVGRDARANYADRRPLERVVKTKVFLAREGWEDFVALAKHIRALKRIVAPGFGAGPLLELLGAPPQTQFMAAPLALEGAAELAAREAAAAAREAELAAREAAVAAREAETAAQAQKLASLLEGL